VRKRPIRGSEEPNRSQVNSSSWEWGRGHFPEIRRNSRRLGKTQEIKNQTGGKTQFQWHLLHKGRRKKRLGKDAKRLGNHDQSYRGEPKGRGLKGNGRKKLLSGSLAGNRSSDQEKLQGAGGGSSSKRKGRSTRLEAIYRPAVCKETRRTEV